MTGAGPSGAGRSPLIGITAYPRVVDIIPVPTVLHTANRFYVDSIVKAGGYPLILPVVDPFAADGVVAVLQGLILPGGGDVDPSAYGEEPAPQTDTVNPDRDAWEMACLRAALEQHLPILATCRGAQILNVTLGGTLVQHIPTATGERHDWVTLYAEQVHPVRLAPHSRLAALLGTTQVGTNSLHHQSVARPGDGVSAVGWAPDGTVEAIEVEDHPEVVAVQWHPELLAGHQAHEGLFRHLVASARAYLGPETYSREVPSGR